MAFGLLNPFNCVGFEVNRFDYWASTYVDLATCVHFRSVAQAEEYDLPRAHYYKPLNTFDRAE